MSTQDPDWPRIRELFDRAVALAPEQRTKLLAREPERVKSEVERLIDLDSRASVLLPGDASDAVAARLVEATWAATLTPGREIGPYRLVRVLGGGGMGVVFEAEERSPNRRVALKTVRAELFTPELLRRFSNEVQLLARLEHPGIARIYSAGTFERAGEECPYYTMELVAGARTIVEHGRDLPVRARLELFLSACDAVEFGHRKGVIHRDLKPGNLLVGADGCLKVIDFGLARPDDATALGAPSQHTRAGLVLGTLPYMSPEHVSGRPFEIDAQSDVHSLGCVLCELVGGRPPHDLFDVPIRTALERIESDEPRLPEELPRELAWIVARAVARERSRRYSSVGELAADVRRFVAGEPVNAAPPSRAYRVRAFARRRRGLLAAAGAVALAVLFGLAAAGVSFVREARARDRAELEADLSGQVSRFLEALFLQGNTYELGPDATLADVLARAVDRIPRVERPDVRAVLLGLAGQGFLNIDDLARAEEFVGEAVRLGAEHLDERSEHRLRAEILWSDVLQRLGRYREARDLAARLVPLAIDELEPHDVYYARNVLATCESLLGRHAEAEAIYRDLLRERTARGDSASARINLRHRVGRMQLMQDEVDAARTTFVDALAKARAEPGLAAYELLLLGELGGLETEAGRLEQAEAYLAEAAEVAEAAGESRYNRAVGALQLASLALAKDDPATAARRVAEARALAVEIPGESELEVRCLLTDAMVRAAEGDRAGGLALAEEALVLAVELSGEDGVAAEVAREIAAELREP